MRILDRYIILLFLRFFSLALGAFSGIYLLVDFIEKVDDFIEHHAAWHLYFAFFLNKLPTIISQITPLAVLLATFLTVAGLSRNGELTAMFSGGIGLARILRPLFLLTLFIVFVNFSVNEYLLPATTEKMNHIFHHQVRKKPITILKEGGTWLRDENRIVHIRAMEPQRMVLQGIVIYTLNDSFQITLSEEAARANYDGHGWIAESALVRRFDPATGAVTHFSRVVQKPLSFHKPPEEFRTADAKREELNFQQLRHYAVKLEMEGFDAASYRVDMHSRLATPFSSFIMTFLGVPFALRGSRRAGVAMGLAVGIAIGMVYFFLQATLTAFGYSALLPPLVAAWSANLIFLLLGLWLFLTLEA
ncbi:MAG: LPS export ABC transporter permease LptG [Deltaproteobacteria bacterium]|nr:LPS export ABC transporter permease LptG [Deltaproteobacteria bacterium]